MSVGYGIGMFFVGLAAITIAAIIAYYIIKRDRDE